MSLARPNLAANPLPTLRPSRRGYRALVVALAAFLAVVTLLRDPFRGYLAEATVAGHAGDDLDLAVARRWLGAAGEGLSVQIVQSAMYPGDCEIKLQTLGLRADAARGELNEVAQRFLSHYLPQQQAIRRQAALNRLQIELQAARDSEDAQRSRVEDLRSRQLAQLVEQQNARPPAARTPDPRLIELRKRLSDLQLELSNLLASYTDEHPQVIAIRSQIDRLEAELGTAGAGTGPELIPSAQLDRGSPVAGETQLVSTASLLPILPAADVAAALELAAGDLAAAIRNRQWAERQLETMLHRSSTSDALLTWSAGPATIVGRVGGTPTPLSLIAASLVALIAGGGMFYYAGRLAARPLIDSTEQLAQLVPLPLVGRVPVACQAGIGRWLRQLMPHAVSKGTLTAELAIVAVAAVCVLSIAADQSLVPQLLADPLGALSEIVSRVGA